MFLIFCRRRFGTRPGSVVMSPMRHVSEPWRIQIECGTWEWDSWNKLRSTSVCLTRNGTGTLTVRQPRSHNGIATIPDPFQNATTSAPWPLIERWPVLRFWFKGDQPCPPPPPLMERQPPMDTELWGNQSWSHASKATAPVPLSLLVNLYPWFTHNNIYSWFRMPLMTTAGTRNIVLSGWSSWFWMSLSMSVV